MSDVFSQIGTAISKNPLSAIGTGITGLTSFFKNRQQNKYLNSQLNYQKFLQGLTGDPAKMSQYIAGFEKPLSTGLTKGVENEVQAAGAERGLSTSPQIMDEILAQALGPYQLQEQSQAINAALSSLGLPFSHGVSGIPGTGPMDISALIKQLLQPTGPSVVSLPTGGPNKVPAPQPDDPEVSPNFPGSGLPGSTAGMDTGGFDDSVFSGMGIG